MTVMNRTVSKSLLRAATFTARDAAADDGGGGDDGLTLEGYAAVFGVKTRINSWEGTFDESIRVGAFRETLREGSPVMQFDHGRHPLIGSIPIGTYDSLSEDEHGLAVHGRLTDNWLIQPVRDAIASKAVNGMSFRFEVIRDAWVDAQGKKIDPTKESDREPFYEILWRGEDHERGPLSRELIKVRMPEAGPVVFPAYGGTEVSVRAAHLARPIMEDETLMQDVRSALAIGTRSDTMELPGDAQLRREIARAVLFGATAGATSTASTTRTDAAPTNGHPAPDDPQEDQDDDLDTDDADTDDDADDDLEDDEQDDPQDNSTTDEDAPTGHGHPSDPPAPRAAAEQNGAPVDTDHASNDQQARERIARLAYISRERVGRTV